MTISLPVRIGFQIDTPDPLFYFDCVTDAVFLFDIIFNFNTGIDSSSNKLIMNRKLIAADYIKLWFWLDLISSTPYSWFIAWSYGISIYELE